MDLRCLIVTPRIEAIAKELNRDPNDVATDISLWQEDNNIKDPDTYPTAQELDAYIKAQQAKDNQSAYQSTLPAKLSDVNRQARIENNTSRLIVQSYNHKFRDKARKAFSNEEYNDRVHEVARLFTTTLSRYIKESYDLYVNNLNELENREDLDDAQKAVRRKKYNIAIRRYGNPDKRGIALRDFGGPEGILNLMHRELSQLYEIQKPNEFAEELQRVFNFTAPTETITDNIDAYKDKLKKIYNNLYYLTLDAADEIEYNEGIRMFLVASEKASENSDYNPTDDDNFKETWMFRYDTRDHMDSTFKPVKRLLASLPIRDYKGNVKLTMFGSPMCYQMQEIVNNLHRELVGVHDSSMMLKLLHAIGRKDINGSSENQWANELVEKLQDNPQLLSQFFGDFRLTHKSFGGIQTTKKGILGFIPYGSRNSYAKRTFIDAAKDNIKNGKVVALRSLYSSKGEVRQDNVKYHLDAIEQLRKKYGEWNRLDQYSPDEIKNILDEDSKIIPVITNALQAFGFPVSMNTAYDSAVSDTPAYGYSNNLSLLTKELYRNLSTLSKNKNADLKDITTRVNRMKQVTNSFVTYDQRIENYDPRISDSEGNKRESFVLPSFLDNMIEGLSGQIYTHDDTANGFHRQTGAEYAEKKFGNTPFYKFKGKWRLRWLEDISNGVFKPKAAEILYAFKSKKPFEKWAERERMQIALTMFNNPEEKGGPYYLLPVISDTQSARFVSAPKYTHEEIVEGLARIIWQELHRNKDNSTIVNYTYQKNREFFCVLPELNDYFKKGGNIAEFRKRLEGLSSYEATDIVNTAAEYVLQKHKDAIRKIVAVNDKNAAAIDEFVENSTLAQIQMLEIFGGDPAFYGDYNPGKTITKYEGYKDLQKRFKEVIVPMKMIDTNNPYGKKSERCLYINDPEFASNVLSQLTKFLDQQYAAGQITQEQYNRMLKKAQEINITDGQAIRSLKSYRQMMNMLGTYDDKVGASIDRIISNKPLKSDRKTYLTPIKPFFYNLVGYSFEGASDNLLSPVQHKCSEELLLPPEMDASMTNGSSLLTALYDFMNDYNDGDGIDTIVFTSSVKVGNNGSIEIKTDGTYEEIYNSISQAVERMPEAIHEIPFEDGYGIVTEVPEHGVDYEDAVGTQIQKLIVADIPDNASFTVSGVDMGKKEIIDLYNKIWTEKIRRAYESITDEIADNEKLSSMLQRAAKISKRKSKSIQHAFELDDNGNFIVPLCDLTNLELSSSLLNSVIHKAVGRIYTNGGQYVQTTAFGVSDKLHLVFKEDSNGKLSLDYIECMMPAWSSDIIKKYMKSDGTIDIKEVPEDLLYAVGYRIPTASKSFMAPLKIVGFTPQIQGNVMILPSDITYLNDSDYDVDKMMTMLPSLTVDSNGKLITSVTKTEYKLENIEKQSDGALNNALLDVMRALLTSPNVASQVVTAGGTDIITTVSNEIQGYIEDVLADVGMSFIGTTIRQYARNNDGKNMIAIFASANSSHAIAQHTKDTGNPLRLNNDVKLFGKSLSSLCKLESTGKYTISQQLGDCLNGAADNAKNPTLYWLNINDETSGVATLLMRLGFTTREVGMFLNIPSIRLYANTSYKDELIKNLNIEFEPTTELDGNIETAINAIKTNDQTSDYAKQALIVFLTLKSAANELFQIDSLTKNDTGRGVPHGSVASNIARWIQYARFASMKAQKQGFISGWQEMFKYASIKYDKVDDTEDLANNITNSNVPIAQSFTSYGFSGEYRIMQKRYPLLGNMNFLNVVSRMIDVSASAQNVEPIVHAAYQFCQTTFDDWKKDGKDMQESQKWYINEFPKQTAKYIIEHPELMDNKLIRNLQFGEDAVNYPFIELMDEDISETERNQYGDAWKELLENDDDKVRTLAIDLYKYGFHKNGLRFGGSFAYLAPAEIRDYVSTLVQDEGNLDIYNNVFSDPNNDMAFFALYMRNNTSKIAIANKNTTKLFKGETINEAPETISFDELGDMQEKIKKPNYKFYFNSQKQPRASFAYELKDGTVYYILHGEGWQKVTPLGWTWRANEYMDMQNPYTTESIYKDYDIESIEAKRRGDKPEVDESENNENEEGLTPSELWTINMPGMTEEDKREIRERAAARKAQKFGEKHDGAISPDMFTRLEFDNLTDMEGNPINVLYAMRLAGEGQYIFYDENYNVITEMLNNGNSIKTMWMIPTMASNKKKVTVSDGWYQGFVNKEMKKNENYKDANGEPICPVK